MPKMKVVVPHALGQEQASTRLKERFHEAKDEFAGQVTDFEENWEGDHVLHFKFKAMGMKVEGTTTVEEKNVNVAANLPMAAMMLKGMIEKRLTEEMQRILA
jgi:hypothetical protein